MKKKLLMSVLGIMMLMSMFSLVAAQPPFEQSLALDKSIQLEVPVISYIEQGKDFKFHIHPHNVTDGLLIPQSEISYCMIHLYSPVDGGHLIEANMTPDSNGIDWEYEVLGGNFTETGQYAVLLYCEVEGEIGGFFEYGFDVLPNGFNGNLTEAQAILYGFILILLGLFLFLAINGVRKAVSAEWLIGYICLSYIALYLIMSFLWLLTKTYLIGIPALESIMFMAWFIMGIGFLPFVFVVSIYILGKEAKAALEQNYIKQGYTPEEARELSKKNKR
jgi:hypothetical protein